MTREGADGQTTLVQRVSILLEPRRIGQQFISRAMCVPGIVAGAELDGGQPEGGDPVEGVLEAQMLEYDREHSELHDV